MLLQQNLIIFNTIAGKIDEKLIPTTYQYQTTLNEPNQNTMILFPTTEDEIQAIIKELKTNKTTGTNSIPTKILENNKNELATPLCDLIKLVLQSGTFPYILETVKHFPIYKEGDPLGCDNYCLISLLSNIRKLIDKLIHVRLNIFLETNNCLYENQFGFRKSHPTKHALITTTAKIRHTLDNKHSICGEFLIFKKLLIQ